MKRLQPVIFLAAVLSVGCRDRELLQPAAPGAPMAVIMDGAHDGNASFFFLPPLVPNPSGFFHAAKFNAGLSPVAEVCELTGDPRLPGPAPTCVAIVFGPASMTLDQSNQHYQLNWDTKASSLVATKFYRILVRGAPRGTVLGFVDVDPVDQGVKNLKTDDVVPFQDGRTLPIKVRIEDGAFGATNPDHVERVVPTSIPTGTLDVTTPTGFAGARFSDGWLPAGIDQVVVIIERVPADNNTVATSCLESGLLEVEGCYRFRTDPDLHSLGLEGTAFRVPVIAGVCVQIPEILHSDAPFQLHRRREQDIEGALTLTGPTEALLSVEAPFLTCGEFTPTPSLRSALRSGRVLDVASAGWHALVRAVGRLVQPRALYAVDFGAGGSTDAFSRFGWARAATLVKVAATDNQVTLTGTKVLLDPTVCLTSLHPRPRPLVNEPVTFTVTAGGGTVGGGTSTIAHTGSTGCASAPWVLGSTTALAGNRLTAAAAALPTTVEFMATGVSDVLPAATVHIDVNDFAIDLSAGRMQNPSGVNGSVFFKDTQVIFGAGFAYATNDADILVGFKTAGQDSDFDPTAPVVVVSETPHHTTAQVRPGTGLSGIPGVAVKQESFAFSNTADAGYVLFKYTLTNGGVDEVRNVFAGFVADPDLLFSETQLDDVAAFNHDLSVAEVTEADNATHTQVIGIVPITSTETNLNYVGWVNGGEPGDPPNSAEYFPRLGAGLPEGAGSVGPDDVRFVTSAGPFSIPAGATQVVWFALVGGDDRAAFEANVGAARRKVAAGGF